MSFDRHMLSWGSIKCYKMLTSTSLSGKTNMNKWGTSKEVILTKSWKASEQWPPGSSKSTCTPNSPPSWWTWSKRGSSTASIKSNKILFQGTPVPSKLKNCWVSSWWFKTSRKPTSLIKISGETKSERSWFICSTQTKTELKIYLSWKFFSRKDINSMKKRTQIIFPTKH